MKFEIFQSDKNEKYYFRLKASNGQVILSSQGYAGKPSCKNGIESVKKNAGNPDCYERKEASNGKLHFNLLAMNKQVIGNSQMYAGKSGMENGIQAVMKVEADTPVVDLTTA
jgi:hypothetical protein